MMPFRFRPIPILALAATLSLAGEAYAQRWSSAEPSGAGAKTAGYSVEGAFDTLWFSCVRSGPGMLSLVFGGFDKGLQDVDHTVVVTVDGTAYLQTTRPAADPAAGNAAAGTTLGRTAPFAELQPLIEALKAGKSVEISSPTGRVTVPLAGSGAALSALQAGCGG